MQKNEVIFDKEMIKKMGKGRAKIHKSVALTMGAAGKNIAYRSAYSGRPVITNDGVSVARMISLTDELESMGAEMLTQSAERTNKEAGDATTATIVLDYAMGEKGLEKVRGKKFLGITIKKGVNSMIVRDQMNRSVDRLIQRIKDISIPIRSYDDLFSIANISFENEENARIVADSIQKVGVDGEVRVEESSGIKIERTDEDGLKFDKGYVHPFMSSDFSKMEAVMADVHVLMTDKAFQMNKDLFPLIEHLNINGVKKLLVICAGMSGEILATVLRNKQEGKFQCVAVDKPFDDEMLEDIAILSGGEVITSAKHPLDVSPTDFICLGKFEKVIVNKDSTLLIGGVGDKEKIKERVELIKKEMEDTEHVYLKEKLKTRIAKILGGVITIKVGAPTESDMKYLKDKFDDAVANTRSALEEGIIPGGGRVLYDFSLENPIDVGDEVVKYACSMPMNTILRNAGIKNNIKKGEVMNVLTGKITNTPIEDGLIDSAKSQRCALKNAVNEAGTFITLEGAVVDIADKKSSDVI